MRQAHHTQDLTTLNHYNRQKLAKSFVWKLISKQFGGQEGFSDLCWSTEQENFIHSFPRHLTDQECDAIASELKSQLEYMFDGLDSELVSELVNQLQTGLQQSNAELFVSELLSFSFETQLEVNKVNLGDKQKALIQPLIDTSVSETQIKAIFDVAEGLSIEKIRPLLKNPNEDEKNIKEIRCQINQALNAAIPVLKKEDYTKPSIVNGKKSQDQYRSLTELADEFANCGFEAYYSSDGLSLLNFCLPLVKKHKLDNTVWWEEWNNGRVEAFKDELAKALLARIVNGKINCVFYKKSGDTQDTNTKKFANKPYEFKSILEIQKFINDIQEQIFPSTDSDKTVFRPHDDDSMREHALADSRQQQLTAGEIHNISDFVKNVIALNFEWDEQANTIRFSQRQKFQIRAFRKLLDSRKNRNPELEFAELQSQLESAFIHAINHGSIKLVDGKTVPVHSVNDLQKYYQTLKAELTNPDIPDVQELFQRLRENDTEYFLHLFEKFEKHRSKIIELLSSEISCEVFVRPERRRKKRIFFHSILNWESLDKEEKERLSEALLDKNKIFVDETTGHQYSEPKSLLEWAYDEDYGFLESSELLISVFKDLKSACQSGSLNPNEQYHFDKLYKKMEVREVLTPQPSPKKTKRSNSLADINTNVIEHLFITFAYLLKTHFELGSHTDISAPMHFEPSEQIVNILSPRAVKKSPELKMAIKVETEQRKEASKEVARYHEEIANEFLRHHCPQLASDLSLTQSSQTHDSIIMTFQHILKDLLEHEDPFSRTELISAAKEMVIKKIHSGDFDTSDDTKKQILDCIEKLITNFIPHQLSLEEKDGRRPSRMKGSTSMPEFTTTIDEKENDSVVVDVVPQSRPRGKTLYFEKASPEKPRQRSYSASDIDHVRVSEEFKRTESKVSESDDENILIKIHKEYFYGKTESANNESNTKNRNARFNDYCDIIALINHLIHDTYDNPSAKRKKLASLTSKLEEEILEYNNDRIDLVIRGCFFANRRTQRFYNLKTMLHEQFNQKYLTSGHYDVQMKYPKDGQEFEAQLHQWKSSPKINNILFIYSPDLDQWEAHWIKDLDCEPKKRTIHRCSPLGKELKKINAENVDSCEKERFIMPLDALINDQQFLSSKADEFIDWLKIQCEELEHYYTQSIQDGRLQTVDKEEHNKLLKALWSYKDQGGQGQDDKGNENSIEDNDYVQYLQ